MKRYFIVMLIPIILFEHKSVAQRLTSFVDPFIGTGGHGHTYPGATVPFGMVQLSPDNGDQGWDWCSGYHYSSDSIVGFSHTHLSGTGIGDWCDISVMPLTMLSPYGSSEKVHFKHANEKASPGFYEVKLDNGIDASFTATERCGFHKYIFPQNIVPVIRFDLGFHINWDHPVETYIRKVDDSTWVGYRISKGWAAIQRVYFAVRTSKPVSDYKISEGRNLINASEAKGKAIQCQLLFHPGGDQEVLMKVALSSISTDKALGALSEIKGWDFDKQKEEASNKWEHELEKVKIQTNDLARKRVFYTSFYHTCMAPVLYSDADGSYRNAQDQVQKMPYGQRYTVYSLWDTFRALDPLFTITQPERVSDIDNTMLAFYNENGLLPIWDLSTYETNTMTGYHAVPVLADAILKGVKGVDAENAFEAMKKSAAQDIRGTDFYRQYHYVPQDKYGSSVTVTIEYAYDDWCIAQVAKKLHHMDDYDQFMKRSAYWKNLFDPATGFIRAKNSDGKWVVPFDPYYSEHDPVKAMYTEGNAWQHSFFVPQDVRGLAAMYGGNSKLGHKFDSLFTVSSKLTGANVSNDISGMIGQYAHGNEPSHHIAYMYSFIGEAWKTQARVREIIDSMYHDQPDGYAGNEDCGQMSAWAVWSMIGFYPANPSSGQYVFGSPELAEVKLKCPRGKQMIIKTKNAGKDHPYIQKVSLNGKPYEKVYINHKTLLKGGVLEFTMGSTPNKNFGKLPSSWPGSN